MADAVKDPKNPVPGDVVIDASDLELVDLSSGKIKNLSKLHEGSDMAIDCVGKVSSEELEDVGITSKDLAELTAAREDHAKATVLLTATEKLKELLHETRLERADRMAKKLGDMAQSVKRRTERYENLTYLMGPLEDLLVYHFGPALKGAITRAKNEAAAAEAAKKAAEEAAGKVEETSEV